VDLVKTHGVQYAKARYNENLINTSIGLVVEELYKTAAGEGLKYFQVKGFIEDVLDYLRRFILVKIVMPISHTTSKFIEDTLNKSIENGWGVDQTVKALADSDITRNRARMIVRTESVRALNYTQLVAADDKNFQVDKQWVAVDDDRTRFGNKPGGHNHLGVDGERVALYEPFSNGLMFPGDPNGEANQTINCRCTLAYSYARDLNGDFIPKGKEGLNLLSKLNLHKV
jgi:hypothetical protein